MKSVNATKKKVYMWVHSRAVLLSFFKNYFHYLSSSAPSTEKSLNLRTPRSLFPSGSLIIRIKLVISLLVNFWLFFVRLYNLEPDSSVTGGAWYSDQDFESEFVDVLNQQCYRYELFLSLENFFSSQSCLNFLKQPICCRYLYGKLEKSRTTNSGPLAARNLSLASSKEVLKFISDLGAIFEKRVNGWFFRQSPKVFFLQVSAKYLYSKRTSSPSWTPWFLTAKWKGRRYTMPGAKSDFTGRSSRCSLLRDSCSCPAASAP